jgi:hypothetical protein
MMLLAEAHAPQAHNFGFQPLLVCVACSRNLGQAPPGRLQRYREWRVDAAFVRAVAAAVGAGAVASKRTSTAPAALWSVNNRARIMGFVPQKSINSHCFY